MSDFKTQQEIWKYLSESEENKVICDSGIILGFKDGIVFNYTNNCESYCIFGDYKAWKKYKEPKKPEKLGRLIVCIKQFKHRDYGDVALGTVEVYFGETPNSEYWEFCIINEKGEVFTLEE